MFHDTTPPQLNGRRDPASVVHVLPGRLDLLRLHGGRLAIIPRVNSTHSLVG
jgi:hypothetical protein